MGYVPQFKNDLFISYRRASNESPDKWIDSFCEALRASLADLVGSVTIWRDQPQLRAGDTWPAEITAALDSAAIFLAVISRTYLDSDECIKELDQFLGRLKDPALGAKRRLVPVFKHPPKPDQSLPPELSRVERLEFFYYPKDSAHFRELGPDCEDADRRVYWETLGRLAQDITAALEELHGSAGRDAMGKVFVARVSPELQLSRERLRSDLQQRGYAVVPEHEYFWNANDLREKIACDLADAKVCVHLVSRSASIEPKSAARARVQLELAQEAMKAKGRPLPMVWIQSASETDASARELLEYIESDLANQGVEYMQGALEDFKTQIYAKLPPAPTQAAVPQARALALLVEEGDIGGLGALKATLTQSLGVEPKSIKFVGAAPKDAQRMVQTLSECDRCLVFWGSQPEEWLQDVLAHQAVKPYLGLERMGVYVAAPASAEKTVFSSTAAQAIQAVDGPGETALRAFIGIVSKC